MTQRAIAAADKAERRNDILAAARALFLQDTHRLPSAAQIAEASGLAKGTVYLYFRTKEEIFIGLLAEDFHGLFDVVTAAFEGEAGDTASRLTAFLEQYLAYLDRHPELLRLDAMAYSVLEQNLSDEQLRAFKLELTLKLVKVGEVVDRALQLPAGRGTTLLMRTYALTRGLWQSLDHSQCLRVLLDDPVFAPIRPDFRPELAAALGEYWRGALSS
ncbi:TetR family transcriptional regulator [Chitinimonas naiadis]